MKKIEKEKIRAYFVSYDEFGKLELYYGDFWRDNDFISVENKNGVNTYFVPPSLYNYGVREFLYVDSCSLPVDFTNSSIVTPKELTECIDSYFVRTICEVEKKSSFTQKFKNKVRHKLDILSMAKKLDDEE